MPYRTRLCGEFDATQIGDVVDASGWTARLRDHGGLVFIDLRDREGVAQVVCDPDRPDMFRTAERIRNEFCVRVTGRVRRRPDGTGNTNLKSGEIEIL